MHDAIGVAFYHVLIRCLQSQRVSERVWTTELVTLNPVKTRPMSGCQDISVQPDGVVNKAEGRVDMIVNSHITCLPLEG